MNPSDLNISAHSSSMSERETAEKSHASRQWPQYLLAILLVVLATFLRAIVDPLFGEKFPYITYLAATSTIAWYCGPRPATFALTLGFLSAFYFFASPRGSFYVSGIDAQVGAVSYIATGAGIIYLFFLVQRAEWEARENADRLWRKQSLLQNEMREKESAQQAVVGLLRKLVQAQEEERRRISRELHDQCGQDLTALRLALKLIEDSLANEPGQTAYFRTASELIDRISSEIHTLALNLRPPELDDHGLVSAIRSHLLTWCEISGLRADFESRISPEVVIPEEVEIALYRTFQESLTNVARHAQASHVSVLLMAHDQRLDLIIEDDGVGFEVHRQQIVEVRPSRLGLLGMQERLLAVGGSLEIESSPGNGTTVFAKVRLDHFGKLSHDDSSRAH